MAGEPNLDGSGLSIAVAVARFNEAITSRLLNGALDAVRRHGVSEHDVYWVPGSFELPVAAKHLAEGGRFDAVVCLGAVIRHETDHYPCTFGVLTCDNDEQALARSGGNRGNKGFEAVESAIEMAKLIRSLRTG